MEYLRHFVDVFLHLDKHLAELIQAVGGWTYGVLFLIVFCETGLVVTPILPGDSLLFAAGALCAVGGLDVKLLIGLLIVAAILGDTVNYWVGQWMGPKVFQMKNSRIFKPEYLRKTQAFYERHGGKTIILARFVPIVRTFAPFVAGVGAMSYKKFLAYNVIGGIVWVASFVLLGYFFGNLPIVKKNFTFVIIAIIILSMLPGLIEYLKHRSSQKPNA